MLALSSRAGIATSTAVIGARSAADAMTTGGRANRRDGGATTDVRRGRTRDPIVLVVVQPDRWLAFIRRGPSFEAWDRHRGPGNVRAPIPLPTCPYTNHP